MSETYGYEEMKAAQEAAKEAAYNDKILKAERYIRQMNNIPPGFNGQPAPKQNNHKPTWHLVIEDMLARDGVGRKRYNTPLQPFNGRDSLQDAYEEALDLCVYLKNAIEERNSGKNISNF